MKKYIPFILRPFFVLFAFLFFGASVFECLFKVFFSSITGYQYDRSSMLSINIMFSLLMKYDTKPKKQLINAEKINYPSTKNRCRRTVKKIQ